MVYDTNPIRTKTPIRAFFIRISRQFALLIARKVLPWPLHCKETSARVRDTANR